MQGINIAPQGISIAPTGVNVAPQGASIGPMLIAVGPYDTTVAPQVRPYPYFPTCLDLSSACCVPVVPPAAVLPTRAAHLFEAPTRLQRRDYAICRISGAFSGYRPQSDFELPAAISMAAKARLGVFVAPGHLADYSPETM